MAKQTRVQHKIKPKHRAVKPRVPRPLDVAQENNHAARHETKKVEARLAEARLLASAAEEADKAELRAMGHAL